MTKNMTCDEIMKEFHKQCSRTCKKDGHCIQYIQLYLDNMACKRQDAYFLEGTKNCPICTEYYLVHSCIKNNIRSKCAEVKVPDDLESSVLQTLKNID